MHVCHTCAVLRGVSCWTLQTSRMSGCNWFWGPRLLFAVQVTTPDDMLVAEGFLISKDSEYSVVGPAGTTNPASELAAASSQVS